MSDAVKWALLVAGVLTLIVAVFTLPFAQFIDFNYIGSLVSDFVDFFGDHLYLARGFINCFLVESARYVLTGLMTYLFFGKILKLTIKITAWIMHFIFK